MLIRSDRRWKYAATMDDVWASINDVDQFVLWWPWLRKFDGTRLAPGEVWQCGVRPPLPYTVEFELRIEGVVPTESVTASVCGDIAGTAEIRLEPRAGGCCVHLVADIGPNSQSLSLLSKAARPLVRFGHNWILDTGARQFGERALPKR